MSACRRPRPDLDRVAEVVDAFLNATSTVVSPDLDAYAAGEIDISQVRCALCTRAPCDCPEFGTPEYYALIDKRHGEEAVITGTFRDLAAALGIDAAALAWQDRAICAETDPEAFFPEKGGSTREAKRVCRTCEVRAECLEYALEHDERFGIWGGRSERERRGLRSERRAA